jgi:hypothetical protein
MRGETSVVYTIDIIDPNRPDAIGSLKIDAETCMFLECIDQQGSVLHLIEHKVLSEHELPEGLFSTLPEGVRILSIPEGWDPKISLQEGKTDRVWVLSTTPEPSAKIGEVLEVTIGYELVSRPHSNLNVYLMPYQPYCAEDPDGCAHGTIGVSRIMVAGAWGL